MPSPLTPIESWFASRNWTAFDFQRQAWTAYLEGRSGLIHAPTGMGKTLAAWLGPVAESLAARGAAGPPDEPEPLRVLWLTPLRALANDTAHSLSQPLADLPLNWSIELRTGDTSSSVKLRQRDRMPTALVTTPESLSILLSYPGVAKRFATLRCIVCDEWHELMSSKRGVQAELAMARLRTLAPGIRTWGLSATLANIDEAAETLVGVTSQSGAGVPPAIDAERDWRPAHPREVDPPLVIHAHADKRIELDTIIPEQIDRFPWAGHLGTALVKPVAERIRSAGTSLVFTNTRSQAELWFRALIRHAPDLIGAVALHHGSIDRGIREQVETMLRGAATDAQRAPTSPPSPLGGEGRVRGSSTTRAQRASALTSPPPPAGDVPSEARRRGAHPTPAERATSSPLRAVVCTSSLDLGVDFYPVDQVIQIGSPKGVARLIQRAGRSGHRPGVPSRVVCVPTNALELAEFAAARDQIEAKRLEARPPIEKPLDLLTQHIVTVAMGDGFNEADLLREVRTTRAFRDLTDQEWEWALDFAGRGGEALVHYPDYQRLTPADNGAEWKGPERRIAMLHRMAIGTIVGDESVLVKYANGRTLGSIEESFIGRLRPGDRFVFSGRTLELKRLREMTATVTRARSGSGAVPRWGGGKMALSSRLADAVLDRFARARAGDFEGPEMTALAPLLTLQHERSRLPVPGELVIERLRTRAGYHAFLYPFAGRLAHEGLGAVLAHRIAQREPRTIRATSNDLGIELWCDEPIDLDERGWRAVLSPERLVEDVLASINASQLARRAFREIARVAGLVHQGYPGQRKRARHLQASSDLFYDVFREFDPSNLLLTQAEREVAEGHLDVRRLRDALDRLSGWDFALVELERLSPMSFPLFAEALRTTTVSTEGWDVRVRKLVARLEEGAEAHA